MNNLAENITRAFADNCKLDDILGDSSFANLLSETPSSASCKRDMFLLPVLTAVSGLMNKCVSRTHRSNISFEEPNIIWSCVASTPGKSISLRKLHYILYSTYPCDSRIFRSKFTSTTARISSVGSSVSSCFFCCDFYL